MITIKQITSTDNDIVYITQRTCEVLLLLDDGTQVKLPILNPDYESDNTQDMCIIKEMPISSVKQPIKDALLEQMNSYSNYLRMKKNQEQ